MNDLKIKIVSALRSQSIPMEMLDISQLIGFRESMTVTTLALEEMLDLRVLAGTFENGVMKFSLRS